MDASSQTYKYPCRPILAAQTPCMPAQRANKTWAEPPSFHSALQYKTREEAQQHNSPCNGMPLNQCRLIISAPVCLPPTFFLAPPCKRPLAPQPLRLLLTDKNELLPLARKRRCPLPAVIHEFLGLQAFSSKRLFAMRSFSLPMVELPCGHCAPSKHVSRGHFSTLSF